MNIGLIPAGATAEKVKVASLIGLGDVVLMQFAVTALKPRSPLLPTRTPTSCFLIADVPVQPPGLDIHEMGGVRMGHDPKTSLLNKWNQLHACKNVFVTDGACMTSTGNQSPSILYMALTARAANYAVDQMKKGQL